MGGAVVGYASALLSAFANGSFASLMKAPAVARLDPPVHPLVFQLYASIGVFLSSMAALALLPLNHEILDDKDAIEHIGLSFYGALAGALFVAATAFSFVAIPLIGVSLAQGIWGGCAILVSCFWGVVVFGNKIVKPALMPVALLLLVVGIVGIALCDRILISKKSSSRENAPGRSSDYEEQGTEEGEEDEEDHDADDEKAELISKADAEVALGMPLNAKPKPEYQDEPSAEGVSSSDTSNSEQANAKKRVLGIMSAILVGLTGGSVLVPAQYEKHFQGVTFLPSFGLGAMIAAPILFTIFSLSQGKVPHLHLRNPVAGAAGIASGVVWNIGNVLQIASIPRISYAVGYSIYQGALFFSGLWGIVLFKEITGFSAIRNFFISALILFGGQVLLAISVKQKS